MSAIKEKEVQAIVNLMLTDEELIGHIYDIVQRQLTSRQLNENPEKKKNNLNYNFDENMDGNSLSLGISWRSDIRWCQQVVSHAIDQTIEDLDIVNVVASVREKCQNKYRPPNKRKSNEKRRSHRDTISVTDERSKMLDESKEIIPNHIKLKENSQDIISAVNPKKSEDSSSKEGTNMIAVSPLSLEGNKTNDNNSNPVTALMSSEIASQAIIADSPIPEGKRASPSEVRTSFDDFKSSTDNDSQELHIPVMKDSSSRYKSSPMKDRHISDEEDDLNNSLTDDSVAMEETSDSDNIHDYLNETIDSDILRISDEVKPNFSATEPIQIKTTPKKRQKKKSRGLRTVPSSKYFDDDDENEFDKILRNNQKVEVSNISSASTLPLGTDSAKLDDSDLWNGRKLPTQTLDQIVPPISDSLGNTTTFDSSDIVKFMTDSNEDNVLISESAEKDTKPLFIEVDDDADNVVLKAKEVINESSENVIGNHEVKDNYLQLNALSPTSSTESSKSPRSPRPITVSIEHNDHSDRSHVIEYESKHNNSKNIDVNEKSINARDPIEEAYGDDFDDITDEIVSNTFMSKADKPQNHAAPISMIDRKVNFKNPLITAINEREKCSREDVSQLFYTHDESMKFEHDYAKELEKAEILGLSWNDWIERRTDDDILRDEAEEKKSVRLEDTGGDSDEDWEKDYDDDFEVSSKHSDDIYDF